MALLNWADYTILGVIGFSVIVSLTRGFVKEALSLATWIIAFWVAFKFVTPFSELLNSYIKSPSLRMLAAFGILFVVTLLLGALINYLLTRLISVTGLGGTDRVLGIIFGGARGVLVITALLMAAKLTPMPKESWWQASVLIPYFVPLEAWLHSVLPQSLLDHLPAALLNGAEISLTTGLAN